MNKLTQIVFFKNKKKKKYKNKRMHKILLGQDSWDGRMNLRQINKTMIKAWNPVGIPMFEGDRHVRIKLLSIFHLYA